MKRPAFQYYPSDWRSDPNLQSCSIGARGLWIEMMNLMHDGKPYGHLKFSKNRLEETKLFSMIGITNEEGFLLLEELENAEVFSRQKDGTIYSRRMVRDEEIRIARAEAGSLGGKQKASKAPSKKLAKGLAKPKQTVEDEDEEEDRSLFEEVKEALKYLNNTAGKKFRLTDSAKTLIAARIKDYSLDEINTVIRKKTKQWLGTEMEKFLRPETLFKASKFDGYINEPEFIPPKKQGVDDAVAQLLAEADELERQGL